MSDTQYASLESGDDQSIDDQRDTASGGLTNDVPGLPTQPPSGPGVRPPSALGGLARTLFGGQPAPRSAGPGRSPWDAPGQSQIPQGPPGGPQSHQNASRWGGTTASLALPQGSMQPQANFTPYMPGLPTTSHQQWGQVNPLDPLPQSFEAPSLYGGVANFFGKNGSAAIIPLALSMGKNGAAFLDGIMKGQEFAAKQRREKMIDDAYQLEQRQHEELSAYYNIVDEYETSSGAAKADAVGNFQIKGETMLDALANKATELGDDQLLGVLGTGNVEKALQFIHRRNDNWQTLAKTNQKTSEQEAADQIWGGSEHPGQQEGDQGAGQGAKYEGAAPIRTPGAPATQTDPGRPAPTLKPADGTVSKEPLGKTESGDTLPPDERSERDKSLDSRAIALLKGYKPQGMEFGGPVEMAAVGKRMIDIKSGLSQIASDPNLKTRQQVLDAVSKQYGPEAADDLAGYADYTRGMGTSTGSGGGGGPEREWFDVLTPLARKIKPPDKVTGLGGWSQRNYNAQQKFQNDNATQTVLLRSNGLGAAADAVREDLAYLEQHGRATEGLDMGQLIGMAERDPIYAKLYGDWNSYNHEYNTIITGGRHTESGEQATEAAAPTSYASPAAFRAVMKGHMQDAYEMIEGEHRRWRTAGGSDDDMPGPLKPDTEKKIRDMRDMDWLYGTLPGQPHTFKSGVTKVWRPKPNSTLDPYDRSNWADD